jgi:hypothetical protein
VKLKIKQELQEKRQAKGKKGRMTKLKKNPTSIEIEITRTRAF